MSCFEQLTQYGSANEWYQRQRQETPDELTTLCLAARFFATCPEDSYRDDTKALELADRAVELSNDTNRWKAIWARTVALAESRRFDQALSSLDEAISIAPEKHKSALDELRDNLSQQKPIRHNPPELPTKP